MKNLSPNLRAVIFVLAAFASWNIADAFLKKLQDTYSFAEAAIYPIICYILYILVVSKKLGGLRPVIETKKKGLHFLRGVFGSCCFLSFVFGIQYITLAEVYTLILTAPFWAAILSIFFFKEKIGWHRWTAILIGFIGVLVILRPGIVSLEPASLLALGGAAGFAMFVIFTKKIGSDEPMINMVLYPILTDLMFLIPIAMFMGYWTPPKLEDIPFFAASGLFYLIGTFASAKGFSSGDSSLLAPLHYSQIVWGALIGYFFFAEVPEIWTFAGAGIIVGSGIYLIYREHKASKTNGTTG